MKNNRIKEFRKKRKISQQELSNKIGISLSNLANIENNRVETNINTALKISEILKVSIEELFN